MSQVRRSSLTSNMKRFLFTIISILSVIVSYGQNAVPVMGTGVSVFDVEVEELSGLCFNEYATRLLSCGDQGVVKSISFTGEVESILVQGADMEGLTGKIARARPSTAVVC